MFRTSRLGRSPTPSTGRDAETRDRISGDACVYIGELEKWYVRERRVNMEEIRDEKIFEHAFMQ